MDARTPEVTWNVLDEEAISPVKRIPHSDFAFDCYSLTLVPILDSRVVNCVTASSGR